MRLDKRKEYILSSIVEEYLIFAEPIGSKLIAKTLELEVSAATVRNEMAELEHMGYIIQPHISAGRVPTEKGYHYYIEHFLEHINLSKKEEEFLQKSFLQDPERKLKNFAKAISEVSRAGVFIAFSKGNLYYTGISNLFSHPEFISCEYTHLMSEIIDDLDEIIFQIFDTVQEEVTIMIGKNNPFGSDCGSLLVKFQQKHSQEGVFGLLGPMRMDYRKNYSVMQYARKLLCQ